MPKFCDKCGAELKDNVKFCHKCGSEVNAFNNNSSSRGITYTCPYCGKSIPYSNKCPYCGKKLQGNDDAAKVEIGIVGIILLFFLITGFLGFLLIIFSGGM